MINEKEFGDWAVVFWKKGSKTLHIAQNQGEPGTTENWMVGTTTRQFDYESGWLPNKEWTSLIKGYFSKDKAIQMARENAEKSLNESEFFRKGQVFEGKNGRLIIKKQVSPDEYLVDYTDFLLPSLSFTEWTFSVDELEEAIKKVQSGEQLVWDHFQSSKLKESESEFYPRETYNKRQRGIDRENNDTLAYGEIDDAMSAEFVKDSFFKNVPGSHHWSEAVGNFAFVCSVDEDNCNKAHFSTYKNKKRIDSKYVYLNGDCVEQFYEYISDWV